MLKGRPAFKRNFWTRFSASMSAISSTGSRSTALEEIVSTSDSSWSRTGPCASDARSKTSCRLPSGAGSRPSNSAKNIIRRRNSSAWPRRLKTVLQPSGIPLIINDRVDVALASGADGVHLGQRDLSVSEARRRLGRDAIIGLSVETMAQALECRRA